MVTVFLRGGLGNQMFQYALGLDLAKKNKTELALDSVFLRDRFPRREFAYRTYDLDVFTLVPHLTPLSKIANAVPIPGLWLAADLALIKAREKLGIQKVLREKNEDVVDPSIFDERGNILLWGRWQSEKYFTDVADEVREAFTFRHPFEGEAKILAEQLRSGNSISLHVRRGDFAAFKNVEKLMGKTDTSYYDRAVAHIAKDHPDATVFVFSDDIAWCRENIKLSLPTTYVDDNSRGPKAAWHLELMSLAKHHIIANSTFSWWGAWLDPRPDKLVIAPARWYADREVQPEIVPSAWIRM